MSHRIIVLEEAEDELIEAQRWYEIQRAGLGQEFRKGNRRGHGPPRRSTAYSFTNLQSFDNHSKSADAR
jgi:hypothetical protein